MVRAVLSDARLWGEDLNQVADLASRVGDYLARIDAVGIKAAMAEAVGM
jgi:mannitol-1-phosphate/altronate dehydrogenase